MIIWIFMVLDIMTLVSISIARFSGFYPAAMLFLSGAYLILKGLLFREWMSLIDAGLGVYILLLGFFHISAFLYYPILFWFLYKFIFTVFS